LLIVEYNKKIVQAAVIMQRLLLLGMILKQVIDSRENCFWD